jgi:hypothetical protein
MESPAIATHAVTWGVSASSLHYSGVILVNLKDVDMADIIGDVENIYQPTDANTIASSLTTEKSNSLVIAAASWQGNDSLPITEDFGTQIAEFSTGGANTADAGTSVASIDGPETPGNVDYGFTGTVIDDFAHCAIEIRGAG